MTGKRILQYAVISHKKPTYLQDKNSKYLQGAMGSHRVVHLTCVKLLHICSMVS